jgi:hypothetical protein
VDGVAMEQSMRLCEYGPDKGKPIQLTQYVILREFARTHGLTNISQRDYPELDKQNFSVEELNLSLDDFSRKQGWIK